MLEKKQSWQMHTQLVGEPKRDHQHDQEIAKHKMYL